MEQPNFWQLAEDKRELQNQNSMLNVANLELTGELDAARLELELLRNIEAEYMAMQDEAEQQAVNAHALEEELERLHSVMEQKEAETKTQIKLVKEANKKIAQLEASLKESQRQKDKAYVSRDVYKKECKQLGNEAHKITKSAQSFANTIDRLSQGSAALVAMLEELADNFLIQHDNDEENLGIMRRTIKEAKGMKYSGTKTIGDLVIELKQKGKI